MLGLTLAFILDPLQQFQGELGHRRRAGIVLGIDFAHGSFSHLTLMIVMTPKPGVRDDQVAMDAGSLLFVGGPIFGWSRPRVFLAAIHSTPPAF